MKEQVKKMRHNTRLRQQYRGCLKGIENPQPGLKLLSQGERKRLRKVENSERSMVKVHPVQIERN